MADSKVLEVIKRLKRRTDEGRIPWQQTVDEGVFQAAFSGYAVRLFPAPSKTGQNATDYVFQIYNEDGALVEEVRDVDYDDPESFESPVFIMMRALYSDARRIAMGVDRAIRTLLDELSDE